MLSWFQVIAVIVSGAAAVGAWVAKIRWANEYQQATDRALHAKDATIQAKDAEIAVLEREVSMLEALDSVKLRERARAMKEGLEAYIAELERDVQNRDERERGLVEQLHHLADDRFGKSEELERLRFELENVRREREYLRTQLQNMRLAGPTFGAGVAEAASEVGFEAGISNYETQGTERLEQIRQALISIGRFLKPTIAIAELQTQDNRPVDVTAVSGPVNVSTATIVPPGVQVDRVEVLVDGTVVCSQAFPHSLTGEPQSLAATLPQHDGELIVICPIQTDVTSRSGARVFPNGPHVLTARILGLDGSILASASQTLIIANPSV